MKKYYRHFLFFSTLKILFSLFFFLHTINLFADEGIWIPLLLKQYNESDMQRLGLKITAEDIYSINHSSLKDAVVLFGRGCTAEIVSAQGLIFTNYHCGKSFVQSHSNLENDYLANGFWALSKEEELTNTGLTASILVRMEDVTDKILRNVSNTMTENHRNEIIENESKKIVEEAVKDTHYDASVKPLFYGNQYFLYVTETFKDVRLVGTPPLSIGDFGGETDNWMWPRHSADFAVFRIYADKNNNPAEYSKNNIPYNPKRFFEISLKGIKENDFTMVYGYPAETEEYLPSYAVEMLTLIDNPVEIKLNGAKLEILKEYMKQDDQTKRQYFSKYNAISNGWKKSIGQNNGLIKFNAVQRKKDFENEFTKWVNENPERTAKYSKLLAAYDSAYKQNTLVEYWTDYYQNAIKNNDIIKYAFTFQNLSLFYKNFSSSLIDNEIEKLKKSSRSFFNNSNPCVNRKLFSTLLQAFYQDVDEKYHPEILKMIRKKFHGDIEKYTDYVFKKSNLTSLKKTNKLLENFKAGSLKKDPLFLLALNFNDYFVENYYLPVMQLESRIDSLDRIFMAAQMKMQTDKIFYPDANFTLRITYGQVKCYSPNDAIDYSYFSTINGVMEKEDTTDNDFKIPKKLKELYRNKDYKEYAENDTLHICFIASNHTSGGNSGSPVLNDKGQLIGINFDRNWEGTMSDIMYDPKICRNICLDIRYCLFIIDKFAGDKRLLDEMKIIR